MSATSALEESEDLEHIPLVRMEDVQPDRSSELFIVNDNEILETCVVDDFNNDEDSNIGSIVCIKTEDVNRADDGDSPELIVPEVLPSATKDLPLTLINVEKTEVKHNSDSWPTLEILPGGVIKHAEKYENDLASLYQSSDMDSEDCDLMYACAKCPQRFKFLFSLVKHVKWHEDQKKKEKAPDFNKNELVEKRIICLPKIKKKKAIISKLKSKCKVPKKS